MASKNKLYDKYEEVWDYHDGFARVKIDGKYAFVDKDGNVSEDRFDDATDYYEHFARVAIKGKLAYRNRKGYINLYSVYDYDWIPGHYYNGYAVINIKGKWAFRNKIGLVSKDRYDEAYHYRDGFALVKIDGKWAFRDAKGKVGNDRYDDAYDYCDGFARVLIDGKWAYRDVKENVGTDRYEIAGNYHDGFALVSIDGKYAFRGIDGNISTDRYDQASHYSGGFADVQINGKRKVRDEKGNLSEDRQYDFHDGFARVKIDDKYAFIDTEGEFVVSKETIKEVLSQDPTQFGFIPKKYFEDKDFINELIDIVKQSLCDKVKNMEKVPEGLVKETIEILEYVKHIIKTQNKEIKAEDKIAVGRKTTPVGKQELLEEINNFDCGIN